MTMFENQRSLFKQVLFYAIVFSSIVLAKDDLVDPRNETGIDIGTQTNIWIENSKDREETGKQLRFVLSVDRNAIDKPAKCCFRFHKSTGDTQKDLMIAEKTLGQFEAFTKDLVLKPESCKFIDASVMAVEVDDDVFVISVNPTRVGNQDSYLSVGQSAIFILEGNRIKLIRSAKQGFSFF